MADKRILISGVAGGSELNLGTDITRILSGLITGDLNSGSGVLDLAAGHLAVSESSPAAMSVDVAVGQVFLKDNTSPFQEKELRVGVVEAAQTGLTVTANSSGSDRIDAAVAYVDMAGSEAARGLDHLAVAVMVGTGTSAMSDAALQTKVDTATGGGYSNVPFLRLADITVANGASSIVDANITDTRTQSALHVPNDTGWRRFPDTVTRTGDHTFTVAGDYTNIFRNGTLIRYIESGTTKEYGTVISSAYTSVTTVTLLTNTDYTMAGNPTDLWYSNEKNAVGHPGSFAFTPTAYDANLAVGNGTVVGRVRIDGGIASGEIKFTLGSSSTVGTGASFAAPVTADTTFDGLHIGLCRFQDDDTSIGYAGPLVIVGSDRLRPTSNLANATYTKQDYIRAAVPMTWATSDYMLIQFRYEIA